MGPSAEGFGPSSEQGAVHSLCPSPGWQSAICTEPGPASPSSRPRQGRQQQVNCSPRVTKLPKSPSKWVAEPGREQSPHAAGPAPQKGTFHPKTQQKTRPDFKKPPQKSQPRRTAAGSKHGGIRGETMINARRCDEQHSSYLNHFAHQLIL